MTKSPGAELRRALKRELWPEGRALELGLEYRGPADFCLREGKIMTARSIRGRFRASLPNLCYHNAISLAVSEGLPYVEGYVWHQRLSAAGSVGVAIPHAWNLDEDGYVVDTTLNEFVIPARERQYRGTPFSAARAHDCSWNGDANVLDDFKRGWPLLRERWQGEDSPGELNGLREKLIEDLLAFEQTGPLTRSALKAGIDPLSPGGRWRL